MVFECISTSTKRIQLVAPTVLCAQGLVSDLCDVDVLTATDKQQTGGESQPLAGCFVDINVRHYTALQLTG